eukprot:Skav227520  [mRNA]  locus=scaffold2269:112500:114746:+ [translate_table: standard]
MPMESANSVATDPAPQSTAKHSVKRGGSIKRSKGFSLGSVPASSTVWETNAIPANKQMRQESKYAASAAAGN